MSKSIITSDFCLEATKTLPPADCVCAPRRAGAIRLIASAIKSYVSGVVARRALRRLEYDMQRISDRMLKDIGIDRSEISRVIHYGREF